MLVALVLLVLSQERKALLGFCLISTRATRMNTGLCVLTGATGGIGQTIGVKERLDLKHGND